MNDYISGIKFSNSYEYKILQKEKYILIRQWYLSDVVRDRNVLHLGCVDHLPLLEEKIRANNWLHAILDTSARRCLGIDINKEGIERIRGIGYADAIVFDFINDPIPEEVINDKWDYAILGEILEHVDNPVTFLRAIRNKLKGHCKEIIITVPNAFYYLNFWFALKNKEFINSDHRYWFSPFTIQKVAHNAGYKNLRVRLISGSLPQNRFLRFLVSRYPIFSDTVMLTAEF